MRLAYWGSGPISNFHIPALHKAGFEFRACYSRPQSDRLKQFAARWDVNAAPDAVTFLDMASDCDAIVLALRTEVMPEAINMALGVGKPLLVEKPGAMRSIELTKLERIAGDVPVMVAYNRRYYESTLAAKKLVADMPPTVSWLTWPDQTATTHQFVINGCHIIDTLRFVYGHLSVNYVGVARPSKGYSSGFVVGFGTDRGDCVTLTVNWGSPQTVEWAISAPDLTMRFQTLESLMIYDRIEVLEPSTANPIRRYIPHESARFSEDPGTGLKPGFERQARAFREVVLTGELQAVDCGLYEARMALELVEEILSRVEQG